MSDQPSTKDSGAPATGTGPETGTTQGNQSEPPEWWKNPPEWLKQAPAAAEAPKTNAGTGSGAGPMSTLIDAINALPEKIMAGMKESSPPAQTAEQTAATTTGPASTSATHEGAPAGVNKPLGNRFTDWWFKG